uniref:Reverse transcriptase domain-containing protein n=1 Tax=Bombyx mori TaxID=7091 RepID=A0A8R2QY62_BOMMO|nr:uncharacterized protein LOC119628917 [Bombyx mori]
MRLSYLPEEMLKNVVVPIVKNRTGDICDKTNYRPISLATIIAKVLDNIQILVRQPAEHGTMVGCLFEAIQDGVRGEARGVDLAQAVQPIYTHVSCHIHEIYLNSISYADDMVLLSASACGLSKLLGICERYALSHGLVYNANNSECMVFQAKGRCLDNIPAVKLNGTPLRRVDKFKYLGYFIACDLRDDADIEWEQRALSLRANINMIARRFALCSRDVKITLLRAFYTYVLLYEQPVGAL